jgi:hypothetical protein
LRKRVFVNVSVRRCVADPTSRKFGKPDATVTAGY